MGKKGYILSGAALLAALTLLAGCGKNNGTEDKNKDKPDTDPAQEIVLVQPEAADVPVDFETGAEGVARRLRLYEDPQRHGLRHPRGRLHRPASGG